MRRSGRTAVELALFAAILLAAAVMRVLNFPMLLGHGEEIAYPSDGDTAYHLYRTMEAVKDFPHVPLFDPWVDWPRGAPCLWSNGYDLLAAAWVRLWGAGADLRGYLLIMLFPIACGLALVAATVALGRRVAPREARGPVALAAGLLVALNPAAVFASSFGRADHHGLEALSAVLLALWALAAARRRASHQALVAITGALAVAFALWVFSGAPVYIAMAALSLGAVALFERAPRVGWGAPAAFALGGGIAALLYEPAIATHGQLLAFKLPSLLQPGLSVGAGALLAIAVGVSRRSRPRRPRLVLFGLAVLALAAVASALPGAHAQLRQGILGWLLHRDPWLATVSEFQSLFTGRDGLRSPLQAALWTFGLPGLLSLALLPIALLQVRGVSGTRALVFGVFAVALLAWTVVQVRFARVAAPFAATVVSIALHRALLVGRRVISPRLLRLAPLLGAAALLAVDPAVYNLFVVPHGEIDPVQDAALAQRPAAAVRPGERAGVLAHWSIGNFVRAIGGRPVVVTGFGTYIDEAAFWEVDAVFSRDEAALVELMERRDLGRLVAGPFVFRSASIEAGTRPFSGGELDGPFFQRVPLAPLLIAGSGIPESGVHHLEHLRPIHATRRLLSGLSFALPVIWSYELVPGARLVGAAVPRARVEARLTFRAWNRPYVWRAWTDSDASGHWEMRVPLPSGDRTSGLRTAARWSVRAGAGAPVEVEASEEAVRRGAIVTVGTLPDSRRAPTP